MLALACFVLLAASRVELVDEVYQIPASEWRYVELGSNSGRRLSPRAMRSPPVRPTSGWHCYAARIWKSCGRERPTASWTSHPNPAGKTELPDTARPAITSSSSTTRRVRPLRCISRSGWISPAWPARDPAPSVAAVDRGRDQLRGVLRNRHVLGAPPAENRAALARRQEPVRESFLDLRQQLHRFDGRLAFFPQHGVQRIGIRRGPLPAFPLGARLGM